MALLFLGLSLPGILWAGEQERPAPASGGQPQARQFRLSGRVFLPDGSPAAGATVTLQLISDVQNPAVHTRTTDAEGRYDFGRLAVPMVDAKKPGSGRISANLEGYGFDVFSVFFRVLEAEEPRFLQVTEEEATWDLHLAVAVLVTGTVVAPDGTPLEGVNVSLRSVGFEGPPGHVGYISLFPEQIAPTTGADGRFAFGGLPAGLRAECWIVKEGYVTVRALLTENGENRFALPPAGAIEGRVIFGDTRKPAGGVPVTVNPWLFRPTSATPLPARATTDERGRFLLEGVPECSGTVMADISRLGWEYVAERAFNVAVRAGETTSGVVLTLTKGGILRGRVVDGETGAPVPMAQVSVLRGGSGRWENYGLLATDDDGRYSIRLPANDEYTIRLAQVPGYFNDWSIRTSELPKVVVPEGGEVEAPLLEAIRAGDITVKVLGPDGKPAAGIQIVAYASSAELAALFSSRTDQNGRLEVKGQKPGVSLQLAARNEDGALRGEGQITPVAGTGNEVVIALAEARPCSVVGKVTDQAGGPISGAHVVLFEPMGAGRWTGRVGAQTDAEGRFEIKGLSPGADLSVTAQQDGYGRQLSEQFSLAEGETYDAGTLTLPRADQELKGRLTDRNGEPLAGRRLIVLGGKSEQQERITGKDGSFHFSGLVNEQVSLYVPDESGSGTPLVSERVQAGQTDVVLTAYQVGEKREAAVRLGQPAPELVLEKGANVSLAELKGRAVVLAFVSIYSRPCVQALLDLKKLQDEKGKDKLAVIAVHDRTATPEEIEAFRKENAITYPIVRVPDAADDGWQAETWRAYGVEDIPTAVLIDAEGKVVSVGDASGLSEKLGQLLQEEKSTSR
jgi:5-hydroxyisourate hydrolase-like protein (transthyretin family)/peroxiredoxin